ncbi:MAG TPA: NADH-quinone oxidoreductase subunit N [Roseiflexaceae bacterium]
MPEIQIPTPDLNIVLQLLIVFGWATLLLLIDLFIPAGQKRITGWLAIAGLIVAAGVGGALWSQQGGASGSTFNDMIRLDNYALALNWIFLLISIITILISLEYLPRQGIERGEYYVLILLATGGMMLLGQGADLIVLFLGLELLSITLYVLVGFAYPRVASEEAAMKYLLIGAFAAGFLVFGIALIYGATGASNLQQIADTLSRQPLAPEDYTVLLAGGALVIVGFGYKIAMAPFHMWTPDVYEGAPTPVTAFMSAGAKAAGFAALTRFLLLAFGSQQNIATWALALAVLAAITMVIGNISAIAQTNVKRMLAYSSIGHAGYILMGVLAASNRGVAGLLFYLLAYSLTNLAAFAVLIALERQGEAAWNMSDFAGLWGRRPWLAAAMALCMFSLAGVPPTAGFVGKFYVFTAAWQSGFQWLVLIAVITSALAAFFYLRIVVQMFMSEPVREASAVSDRSLRLGIGLATIGILLFGIVPTLVITVVEQSVLALGR